MTRRWLTGCVASAFVCAGLLSPGGASGAAPTFERIVIDETFPGETLTPACGVEVTIRFQGELLLRTFEGTETGVSQLGTGNFAITATAGDRIFRFRSVGADITRIEPDGTVVLSTTGQVPLAFAGVLKVNLETGETILEPRDRSEEQIARACAALTGE